MICVMAAYDLHVVRNAAQSRFFLAVLPNKAAYDLCHGCLWATMTAPELRFLNTASPEFTFCCRFWVLSPKISETCPMLRSTIVGGLLVPNIVF